MVAMDPLRELLKAVQNGELDTDAALEQLRYLPYTDLGYAKIDTHRPLRKGLPEVILCESKTTEQVTGIIAELAAAGQNILGTRVRPEMARELTKRFPKIEHNPLARTIWWQQHEVPRKSGIEIGRAHV